MLALIDRVLDSGRDVILLLPEIALTPQTLSIFCARYGDNVALLHSGMSAGERQDSYNRIKSGAARLVIGTRSAIFAPTKRKTIKGEGLYPLFPQFFPDSNTEFLYNRRCGAQRS